MGTVIPTFCSHAVMSTLTSCCVALLNSVIAFCKFHEVKPLLLLAQFLVMGHKHFATFN